MPRVLVTGGTGLIGSEAVRQLVGLGNEVTVLDNIPNLVNIEDVADSVDVIAGDITDSAFVLSLMSGKRIERVMHLAASIHHSAVARPLAAVHTNVIATGNIFEAALAVGAARVCVASTIAVLGGASLYPKTPVDETAPPAPAHVYGATKHLVEILTKSYRADRGLDVTAIRPVFAYGVGRLFGGTGSVNNTIRELALGRPGVLGNIGTADTPLQMIYVPDMAATFVAATMNETVSSPIYNSPVQGWITAVDLFDTIRTVIPGAELEFQPTLLAGYQPTPPVDGSLAQRELGVVPKWSLEEGLSDMVRFFRDQEAKK